jgi:hypothetical protein
MSDEDKPFVCYRQGRFGMKIMPRNGEGWRLFAMWMTVLLAMSGVYAWLVASAPQDDAFVGWVTFGFLVVTTIWAVAMIRWMMARSEIIRLDDVLAWKREQERSKDKGRR